MRAASLVRPVLFLLLVGAAATVARSGWKLRQSVQLARDSTPFQAQPAKPAKSLLIVGDSTAVGTGATDPTQSIAGLLGATTMNLRIENRAADGARYADFASQLQSSPDRFDAILVLGGGNDVIRATSRETLQRQVRQTAQLARQRSDIVVLMPPGNVGNAPFFTRPFSWWMDRRSQTLHDLVRAAALSTGATYVNLYRPRAQDPFAQRPAELHARDGLHPSDAGYELWLQELETQAGLSGMLSARGRVLGNR